MINVLDALESKYMVHLLFCFIDGVFWKIGYYYVQMRKHLQFCLSAY